MIVFYIAYHSGHTPPATAHKFTGDISFVGSDILLHDSNTYFSHTRRRKATIFDTSTTPPTLIREDFNLTELRNLGAALPDFYIDRQGNMKDKNGEMVFQGPDNP